MDNLSSLIITLSLISLFFAMGVGILKNRGKSFSSEEIAFRIKIPLQLNYMLNNLGYYFRSYKP